MRGGGFMGSVFAVTYAIGIDLGFRRRFRCCARRGWCRLQRHIELWRIVLGFDHDLVAAAVELFLGFQIQALTVMAGFFSYSTSNWSKRPVSPLALATFSAS